MAVGKFDAAAVVVFDTAANASGAAVNFPKKNVSSINLPLFERHNLSMPFRLSAILANSTKVSDILKFTRGDTSKKPIAFFSAYVSASA